MADEKNEISMHIKNFFEVHRELYGDSLIRARNVPGSVPPKKIEPLKIQQSKIEYSEPLPIQQEKPIVKEAASYQASGKIATLDELKQQVSGCKKCTLCKTRTQTVFGSGSPKADIMFIGEAPGADEDEQGLPFVGRAGQLLTKMIEEPRSLGMQRSDVYIANILKCRPPGNRKPEPAEVAQCEPYLIAQIEQIKPKIICALGATAANTLLKNTTPISAMRGQVFDYHGVPMLITFHPAALLRKQEWKRLAWEDMLTLRGLVEKMKK